MTTLQYSAIRITLASGVAYVTIDNPPVNVLDVRLMTELRDYLLGVRDDPSVKVIVFQSADPEFFIAHVDMTLIDSQHTLVDLARDVPPDQNLFQAFSELVRHQPQVTIVKLAGLARGGGAEFVTAADMAFAAIGQAGLGQIEALMGIVPGGGGTQYLTQRMGRSRALEVLLGADLVDAVTAERYGWVNRAVPAVELDDFVDRLARQIAALPDGVIAEAKRAVSQTDLSAGFIRENAAWATLAFRPLAEQILRGGLAQGAQTREGERQLESLMRTVNDRLALP